MLWLLPSPDCTRRPQDLWATLMGEDHSCARFASDHWSAFVTRTWPREIPCVHAAMPALGFGNVLWGWLLPALAVALDGGRPLALTLEPRQHELAALLALLGVRSSTSPPHNCSSDGLSTSFGWGMHAVQHASVRSAAARLSAAIYPDNPSRAPWGCLLRLFAACPDPALARTVLAIRRQLLGGRGEGGAVGRYVRELCGDNFRQDGPARHISADAAGEHDEASLPLEGGVHTLDRAYINLTGWNGHNADGVALSRAGGAWEEVRIRQCQGLVVAIALTDSADGKCPLVVVPASHKSGLPAPPLSSSSPFAERSALAAECDLNTTLLNLEPGDVERQRDGLAAMRSFMPIV